MIPNGNCLAPNLDKEVKGLIGRAELVGRRAEEDSAVGQLAPPDNHLHSQNSIKTVILLFQQSLLMVKIE